MKERSTSKKIPEARTRGFLLKEVFLKVSQNSNTSNRVSFSVKLQNTGKGFFL